MKAPIITHPKASPGYNHKRSMSMIIPGHCKLMSFQGYVDYCNVEKSARWQRASDGRTYCNVYAHDIALQQGQFIPRVWWNDPAESESTPPIYGKTVRELSANALYNWFDKWGRQFGWKPIETNHAQAIANGGGFVIITGYNNKGSGHIAVVLPGGETNTDRPNMTDAGYHNHACYNDQWWLKHVDKYKCYAIGK